MKRLLGKLVWVVIIVGLVGLVYWLMRPGPVTVEIGVATRGAIEDYVAEEAKTRLHTLRLVTALTGGVAARIELEVGDTVREGQVITSIEDTQLKAMLDGALAQIKEAEGHIAGIGAALPEKSEIAAAEKNAVAAAIAVEVARTGVEVAGQNLSLTEKELVRAEALVERGVFTRELYDQRFRNHEVAQRELAVAHNRVAIAEAQHKTALLQKDILLESMDDVAHLEQVYGARIEQVRAQITSLSRDLAWTQVRAPIAGVVLEKLVDSEGHVAPGTGLLVVGDMTSLEVESDILSDEIHRVRVGQTVRLEGECLGGEPASGKVTKIYPAGFTKISALGLRQQRIKVIIGFDDGGLMIGPGYKLDVKIVTDVRDDVVLVPAAAVFATADGMAVFRVAEGRAELVPVEIGIRGEDRFEVISGLPEGDRVVLYPPSNLKSGRHVVEEKE